MRKINRNISEFELKHELESLSPRSSLKIESEYKKNYLKIVRESESSYFAIANFEFETRKRSNRLLSCLEILDLSKQYLTGGQTWRKVVDWDELPVEPYKMPFWLSFTQALFFILLILDKLFSEQVESFSENIGLGEFGIRWLILISALISFTPNALMSLYYDRPGRERFNSLMILILVFMLVFFKACELV
jgi:hypothetical protein